MKSNIPIGASPPAADSIDAAPKKNGLTNGNVEKVNGESNNMNGHGVSKNGKFFLFLIELKGWF